MYRIALLISIVFTLSLAGCTQSGGTVDSGTPYDSRTADSEGAIQHDGEMPDSDEQTPQDGQYVEYVESNKYFASMSPSELLTYMLGWEELRFAIGKYDYSKTRGDSIWDLMNTSMVFYCWNPELGEGAYWGGLETLDKELLLFNGKPLSDGSKCAAVAENIKYVLPGWDGERSFSKEQVLAAGGDVSWVKAKPPESAYLEYDYGEFKACIFTNDAGTELIDGKNVLLMDSSAEMETLTGFHSVDILEALKAPDDARNGEEWRVANVYLDYLRKSPEEIMANFPGDYESPNDHLFKHTSADVIFDGQDGICNSIRVPVEYVFPDLIGKGAEHVKALNAPFEFSSDSNIYQIHFENAFTIHIFADEYGNVLAGKNVHMWIWSW
jgi:hypothetical protein